MMKMKISDEIMMDDDDVDRNGIVMKMIIIMTMMTVMMKMKM